MKNKILILFLIGVVTPQLVFAAWWNPFTWSIFHMSGKKTQVIETQQSVELGNRFELGNRYGLVNNATSTTSTTSRNSSKIKKTTALPKSPTLSPVISPAPTTYIEPWEQIEPKNFVYGDQVGWTAMLITHPTTGEKRYYRKEGTQWVRKSSQAEAMQPYQSAIQPAAQPVTQTKTLTNLDTLLRIMDDQIAEKHRQTELALQQLKTLTDERNALTAPIQSELDALNAKIDQECNVSLAQIQGELAQRCNTYYGQALIITTKISGINEQYRVKMGFAPSTNFTTQQSVLGQHYEIYYDGYGGGSIYNSNNPTESYKVYCAYSKCDIYGN